MREDGRGAQLGTNLRREQDALRLGNRLARGESPLRHHNRRNVAVDISDICNTGGVINVTVLLVPTLAGGNNDISAHRNVGSVSTSIQGSVRVTVVGHYGVGTAWYSVRFPEYKSGLSRGQDGTTPYYANEPAPQESRLVVWLTPFQVS